LPAEPIDEVLRAHAHHLLAVPGVVGIAQGLCEGQPCIRVMVVQKTAELASRIPSEFHGYPVTIQETGEIGALDSTRD
jgi:hypothetical protein